jgi:hypothetical protein
MITILSPGGNVVVRADRTDVSHHLARQALLTPAGAVVVVGDGGWDPATLTLQCRVSDVSAADAVAAWRDLIAAAKAATGLQLHDSVVDVDGVRSVRSVPHGTWWDVTLTWLPLSLVGARGPGELEVPETPPYFMVSDTEYLAFDVLGTPVVWTED